MILACSNLSKSFGTDQILKNVSFHINEHEKAAIVGINGAGKSTLLNIIMGELPADEGTVTMTRGISVGYLPQYQMEIAHRTIYDEVLEGKKELLALEARLQELEAGMDRVAPDEMADYMNVYHQIHAEFEAKDGYSLRSEVSGALKGLGFSEEDFGKYCDELSGGQKTRVALARILCSRPDLILLDEPTNHLDIDSITWLENYLLNYKGAVVIVAHDRYFLDRVVSKVIAISRTEAAVYEGNYTEYAKKAAKRREDQMKAWLNQQREIKHQQQVIDKLKSFNREKSIKRAESREKALDKIERLERPEEEDSAMRFTLTPQIISGNDVCMIEGLAKGFGEKQLFSDLSFDIKRGERVALIGQNGTGKTTILKILNEKIPADAGTIRLGTNVRIGYYDQEQQELHDEKTVFGEISDDYPRLTETRIRNVLAAFLFKGDDVYKRIADLSGGERGRLSLAKLMLSDANFLILDEPTNHLDMESKEILEDALCRYEGTVLFVSHDRYFINRAATRILNLTGGLLVNYIGNYDYYLSKKEDNEAAAFRQAGTAAGSPDQPEEAVSAGRTDWAAQKAQQAQERKRRNRAAKLEEQIGAAEARIAEINDLFAQPEIATNSARLNELAAEQKELEDALLPMYEEWEELLSD